MNSIRLALLVGLPLLVSSAFAQPKTELGKNETADDKTITVEFGGNVKLKMIRIPKGSFLMGSKKTDDLNAKKDELPQHNVEFANDFHLGETEVTVGQFKQFVADSGYKTEAERDASDCTWKTPKYPKEMQTDDHPVVRVAYNDALAFCTWLSRKTGSSYGLPTEAQWEYACRAGSKTIYSFGDDVRQLGEYAWFMDNTKESGPRAVRQKKPNAFGLFDMHGNVREWLADHYTYWGYDKRTDILLKSNLRVIRGGGWALEASRCRSADRDADVPVARSTTVGFRVARVP